MKLKILSYNIHKGFSTSGVDFTLHKIKESLQITNADILFLQEVVGENIHHKKKIQNWPTESQFEFLADSNWSHFSYGKNAVYDGRHHGNAILSKFPITFSENLNISTNKLEQRGLLHAIIEIPDIKKSLHLFNVHLNLFESSRKKQIQMIHNRFKNQVPEHESFILAGDFNDWTGSLNKLATSLLGVHEAHNHHHKKLAKSFPAFAPTLSLDRVYVKNLHIESAEVLSGSPWNRLSDHLPLLIEIKLR